MREGAADGGARERPQRRLRRALQRGGGLGDERPVGAAGAFYFCAHALQRCESAAALSIFEHERLEALRQEGLALEAAEAARRAEEERLEYERKLDRDARYAARKERKKKAKSAFERFR